MRVRGALLLMALVSLAGAASAQEVDCSQPFGATASLCAERDLARADAELNAAYRAARDAARRFDAEFPDLPGTPMAAQLLNAQRRWIAFRDAACNAEAKPRSAGGAGYGATLGQCAARLTRRRTEDLRALAEGLR